DNRVLSKVTQGITTEVTGEGTSVAPLTDALAADDSAAMKKYHYREDWRDLDGYFTQLARTGSTVNIATFVGATQVRLAVIGETVQIARDARIPVEIWHLKVSGRLNWGRMPAVLARIDSARAAGLDITADQYPYTAAATSLAASIPAWAHSGGTDSLIPRLRDP